MISTSENVVIYNTSESDGVDICIKDSANRYVLIHESDLEFVIEALVKASLQDNSTESVREDFNWIEEHHF